MRPISARATEIVGSNFRATDVAPLVQRVFVDDVPQLWLGRVPAAVYDSGHELHVEDPAGHERIGKQIRQLRRDAAR